MATANAAPALAPSSRLAPPARREPGRITLAVAALHARLLGLLGGIGHFGAALLASFRVFTLIPAEKPRPSRLLAGPHAPPADCAESPRPRRRPALPRLAFPHLTLPHLTLPHLTLPRLTLPRFALPRFALPGLTLPRLSLPHLAIPAFRLPRLRLPALPLPRWNLALPRLPATPLMLARLRAKRTRAPAIPEEAIGFQGELEDLLGERPPPFLGSAHYLVVALFLLLILGAAIAEVDVVVTGQGRLAADSPPIVLQPIERAIIREIRVRPGESVQRGQVLAVLDPTFAEADTAALTAQRRSLTAQSRRIAAELANERPPVGTATEPDALLQAVLQAQRMAVRDARLRAFDAEIASLAAGIRTVEQSAGQRAEQVGLARDVETMRAQLAQQQVGSRLNLLGARSNRVQAEQELSQALNRITELQHSLRSKQADRETFLDDWRRQLMEDGVRVRAELIRVEEMLGKAQRLSELTMVTAPQDSIVLEVARRSVGSVIREAEPLITLIPRDVPLIADIALRSADIGHARPGDPVVIKVDAFPFQRHGALQGRLRSIAQDSANRTETPDARAPQPGLHAGQVQITGRSLTGLAEGIDITPGMTLTAEIKVGTRSVLSYFLNPITRGFQESIREP